MNPLPVTLPPRRALSVLCLGAHPDDIEIGCGGTILRLLTAHPACRVTWVVLSGGGTPRAREARASARRFLRRAPHTRVRVERFRDAFFPDEYRPLKEYFETLKPCEPDLVFTHQLDDRHQDHRLVAELTWNAFRSQQILEYEIPKYEGVAAVPNVFVPLSRAIRKRKCRILLSAFRSQRPKSWFTAETFDAVMRLRGTEIRSPEGYAEAFVGRRLLFAP